MSRSEKFAGIFWMIGYCFIGVRVGIFGTNSIKLKINRDTNGCSLKNNNYLFFNRISYFTDSGEQINWVIRPVKMIVNDKPVT